MSEQKLQVKTITCHDVYNFGASLQTYALMTYLQRLGHHVEIIDYKPDYLTFNLWTIGDKWKKNIFLRLAYYVYVVPKRINMRSRRRKFDEFTRTKLCLTTQKFRSLDELKQTPPKAEVFFAGSDQIWNPLLPNGKDPAFFLAFAPQRSVKASYAASFAVSDIPPELVGQTAELLKHLDYVSVRESSGLAILQKYGVKGNLVVDPVYLLQESEWSEQVPHSTQESYILVYDQENNGLIKEAAVMLSKKHGWKIYAIEALYPMRYADKRIKDAGPEDFLALIKNSQVCLTNSFHCISFSLIFRKRFFLFKRTHLSVNSRMVDLLNYLELQSHIIDQVDDTLTINEIEYEEVTNKLERMKNDSYQFIQEALNAAANA